MRRRCLACRRRAIESGSYCANCRPRNGSTRRWRIIRAKVLERDGYRCQRCGQPAQHVDHVFPVALGGTDDLSNLRALCAKHNLAKGDS